MKMPEKINVKTVGVIVCLTILITSGFFYALATTSSSTFVISGGIYPGAPTYTVWKEGSNYFVKDKHGTLRTSGTNATVVLRAVFSSLTDGDNVLFKEATYLLTGNFNYDNDIFRITENNITLQGVGYGTIFRMANNSTRGTDGARIFWIGGDNCILQNFQVDGNYKNQGTINQSRDGFNIHINGDNNLVTGILSQYATGDGVEFGGYRNTIINCKFIENWEHNIHANQAKDAVIANNVLENEINNGMLSLNPTNAASSTQKVVVTGNILRGGQENGIKVGGTGDCYHVVISNNVIIGTKGHGIYVKGVGTNKNIRIENNIIRSTTQDGIRVDHAENIVIQGNTIDHCGENGINFRLTTACSEISISGNRIIDNNQDDARKSGIIIANENYNADFLIIKLNEITSTCTPQHYYGVRIGSSGSGTYSDTYINYNYIKNYDSSAISLGKSVTNSSSNWT